MTTQPVAVPRLYAGYTEEEASRALFDFLRIPLTEDQKERFEEKSDFGTEARRVALHNWRMEGLDFFNDLNAIALVRAKMNREQADDFCAILVKMVNQQENAALFYLTWRMVNADAATQVGPALHALGLGKEGTL